MSTNATTCAKCGAAGPEEARFCPSCGAPLGAVAPPPPPVAVPSPPPAYYQAPAPQSKNSTLPLVLVIVGLALLALVAVAGVAAWFTLGQRTSQTVTTTVKELPSGTETVTSGPPAPEPPKQSVIEVGDSTNPDEPPAATPVEDISLAGVGEGEHIGPVTSGDHAAALVLGTAEAETWAAAVAKARQEGKKRRGLVTVERKPNGHYLVHVSESVEDDEPGHTATFGWFDVDDKMGAIKSDLVDTD